MGSNRKIKQIIQLPKIVVAVPALIYWCEIQQLFLWDQWIIRSGISLQRKQVRYVTPRDSVGLIVTSDVREQYRSAPLSYTYTYKYKYRREQYRSPPLSKANVLRSSVKLMCRQMSPFIFNESRHDHQFSHALLL